MEFLSSRPEAPGLGDPLRLPAPAGNRRGSIVCCCFQKGPCSGFFRLLDKFEVRCRPARVVTCLLRQVPSRQIIVSPRRQRARGRRSSWSPPGPMSRSCRSSSPLRSAREPWVGRGCGSRPTQSPGIGRPSSAFSALGALWLSAWSCGLGRVDMHALRVLACSTCSSRLFPSIPGGGEHF